MAKISQREARQLRKRVAELERQISNQRHAWAAEWPGGVHLCSIAVTSAERAAVLTARKLRHAVVVTTPNDARIEVYALPQAADRRSA